MSTQLKQSLTGGIIATVIMSVIMMILPVFGMPKLDAAQMLSMMMSLPIAVGWIMHFMIGIIFAMSYAYFFINLVRKVSNTILKGTIFGLAVFIFAQIIMGLMGLILPMPEMEGSRLLIMIASITGHIVYGITVALFVKE